MSHTKDTKIVCNPDYGFYQVSPTPSEDELRSLYAEQFYQNDKPGYLSSVSQQLDYWNDIWGMRLSLIEQHVGTNKHIIDIGAGGGFFLNCAQSRGWTVSGVEPSTQACEHADKQFGIKLFQGLLDDYPQPATKFNAAYISLVLEHVPDPEAFIRKVLGLLAPGGVLWIETPNDFNALQKTIQTQMSKPEWWVVPNHHLNYFNYQTLSKLLTSAGMSELDRLASFPVEMFALMGLDYIDHAEVGTDIHKYRMNFERNLLANDAELLIDLYRNLAQQGLGRTCNLLCQKQ